MKKALLAASLLCAATLSYAGEPNGTMALQRSGKNVISNGFFLHLGLGFPSMSVNSTSQSMGLQPNLEIGNQWYFVKKEKFGFGLKVSWLHFGYSSYKPDGYTSSNDKRTGNFDFRFLKVAPQATFGFSDEMGLDVYLDIAPTVLVGANQTPNASYAYAGVGVLFAPGARFRYNKFAAGFDVSFGSVPLTIASDDLTYLDDVKQTASIVSPRVYVGFKF